MKAKLLLIILILGVFSVQAQKTSIFKGNANADPELYGQKILYYINQAENLMLQGHHEDAIITFDKAIAQAPDFAETYIRRSMALYKIGRFAEAQQDYVTATRLNPYIGDLYGYQSDLRKLKILAFDPLKFTELPSLSYRMTYYDDLFENEFVLDSVLEQNPPTDYILQKSIFNIKQGKITLALSDLNSLKSENNAILYDLKGLIYTEINDYELAGKYLENVIAIAPDYELAYLNLSLVRMNEGDLTEALVLVDKVIERNPNMRKAYYYRATLYKKMGKNDKALKEYDKVEKKFDNNGYHFFLNRAIAEKMSGDALNALEDLNTAIELETENATLYKLRGNVHILLKNYSAAVEDYNEAINLNNGFSEAYFNRGIANLLGNNRTKACEDFSLSVEFGYEKGEEKLKYFCSF